MSHSAELPFSDTTDPADWPDCEHGFNVSCSQCGLDRTKEKREWDKQHG